MPRGYGDVMELGDLLGVLDLEVLGAGRYRGANLPGPAVVVFGGQIMAQSIVAGAAVDPAKELASLSVIFARGARPDQPLDIDVEPMATGRTFSSATVTVRQGDRLCARSMVLLSAPDADRIRHEPPGPLVAPPSAPIPPGYGSPAWEIAVVGEVDINDPDAVGPPELAVWSRFPGLSADPVLSKAVACYASEGFLIGTAMRPHRGAGQALAHVSIDTTVVSHSVSFHEPFQASEWLLMNFESPYAGRGRTYGRGQIYSSDGHLVASVVQDNMVRAFPTPTGAGRS